MHNPTLESVQEEKIGTNTLAYLFSTEESET